MDLVTGLFVTALFKATEIIWSKSFEAAWSPVDEGLKARFSRWAGKDQERARRAAFAQAVELARQRTIATAADPAQAEIVLRLLDERIDREAAEQLAAECARLLLFADAPNLNALTDICERTLRFQAALDRTSAPSAEVIATVLASFVGQLRAALLDQPPYHELTQKEMLRTLQSILDELRAPPAYDDETTYRQQVARHYSGLDFVGIPEIKDQQPITVKDIFIRLRAQPEPRLLLSNTASLDTEEPRPAQPIKDVTPQEVTLSAALHSASAFVVLGDPGSGKTTLLKYVTVICAEGRGQAELGLAAPDGGTLLPIFAPLRLFAAEVAGRQVDYGLLDFFCTAAHERLESRLPRSFFEQALAAGRCLVCLDGLDEVWAVGQRVQVRDAVQSLMSRFPRNRYIVTSRIVGYDDAPLDRRAFAHHTVLPLSDDDIREFVGKWYDQREADPVRRKQQVADLIGTIERETRIQTLARNPLLLTIIALVHRIEAELPNERVKLYDKCVGALLETWENVKALTIEEKQRPFYRHRRWLLERLAYELHTRAEQAGEVRTVKAGDLELLLARFLMQKRQLDLADDLDTARSEAQAFVRLARSRTGLLVERGDGEFGFPHLTFQEYLAACDIEKRNMQGGTEAIWAEIKEQLHDPHWREVILLLLGSLNKYDNVPSALAERILAAGQADRFEPVLRRHLLLAARALADRVDVAASVRRQIVDELVAIVASCTGVGFSFDGKHIGLMEVAGDALAALRALRGDAYATQQLDALVQDAAVQPTVRAAAASALSQISSSEQTAATLERVIADDSLGETLRAILADALARQGRLEAAAAFLLDLGTREKLSSWGREIVAGMLEQLDRQEEAIKVYQTILTSGNYWEAHHLSAARALIRLGRPDLAAPDLLDMLDSFRDEDEDRSDVARELHEIGYGAEAAARLLELAQDHEEAPHDRIDAAIALGQVDRIEDAVRLLSEFGADPGLDMHDRSDAAWGLFNLERFNEAVAIWLPLIAARPLDLNIFNGLAGALERLGRADEMRTLLAELAADPQLSVEDRATVATAALSAHQDDLAVKLNAELVRDEAVDLQTRVTAALGRAQFHDANEAVELLLALVLDETVEVPTRQQAMHALWRLQKADDRVLQALLALLRDAATPLPLRTAALQALSKLSQPAAATAALLEVARDATCSAQLRRAAIDSIARLGPNQEAADLLLALAGDDRDLYRLLKRLVEGAA